MNKLNKSRRSQLPTFYKEHVTIYYYIYIYIKDWYTPCLFKQVKIWCQPIPITNLVGTPVIGQVHLLSPFRYPRNRKGRWSKFMRNSCKSLVKCLTKSIATSHDSDDILMIFKSMTSKQFKTSMSGNTERIKINTI